MGAHFVNDSKGIYIMGEFVHQPYIPGETVAAVATPPGEGGVAIIRISGRDAVAVADALFSAPVASYRSHTAHYGNVLDRNGDIVDDVLLLPMLGERSFTGEDTVEIHCHGGALITRRVMEVVLAAGARQALPGEFTFKAFMNGKIDLAQAEAIQELIAAKNERALNAAEEQRKGALSDKVRSFQAALTDAAAILDAWVDFPEEGLEFTTPEALTMQIRAVCEAIEQLVATYHDGKIIHDGIALCLAGSPNVGKSSLMNALLDKERAIVSDRAGTTRDIVEDSMRINSLHFCLIDTAGIHDAQEEVEQEGIRRTRKAMRNADLILLVLDATRGLSDDDQKLLTDADPTKTIVVWNKIDLPYPPLPMLSLPHVATVSAKTRSGFNALHTLIDSVIWECGPPSREEVLITNARHKEALVAAASAARSVVIGLENRLSPEFLAADMRAALAALGRIIGVDVGEELLTAIFSKFCIGK